MSAAMRLPDARYKVQDSERANFERDGVICLRGVVPPNEVAGMLATTLEFMESGRGRVREGKREPGAAGRFFSAAYMSATEPAFRAFAHNSVLPGVAAQLMGGETTRFYYDQLFVKEPGTQAPTPWHNDLPFWPFRGNDLISLWVALTPVNRETSGLEYVAGSHKWNKSFRAITPDYDPRFADATLEPCPDYSDPENRQGVNVVSWDMRPGDVLAHHPMAVHGAGGNASAVERRVGLSIRYLGRDVAWDPRPFTTTPPHPPAVPAGAYPADDEAFPIVWRSRA